ncbi:hypothetical protein [Magnetospira sp. QH-2]|uniref:hypothetical protein n=1 Tax=Magnetospira sp. (strain QH-2) TaxID=1288970 RepID=UPI0003E81216|nr:hypothetical protein [Magnetospira sp. QH-2]CCQ75276.1 conserved exported protein of unknown function [Magnetospira sp. QH-2]
MIHGTPNNAMAEIALALAMGFFSIMVLTLVSMGGGLVASADLPLADSGAALGKTQTDSAQQASGPAVPRDSVVIYHKDQFYDGGLKPLDPASLAGRERVVLAVDPDLPMARALKARDQIPVASLTMAPLDDRWRQALKEKQP